MKKSFKHRLLSALMAGLLCVSMLPSAFAAAAPEPNMAATPESSTPAPDAGKTSDPTHAGEPAPAADTAPDTEPDADTGNGVFGFVIPKPSPEPGETPAPETEIVRGQTDETERSAAPEPTEEPTPTEEPSTPEPAEPEQNEIPPIVVPDALDILYGELPDKPTGSYIGQYGLPIATGETRISLGPWADELLGEECIGHLDAAAFDDGAPSLTVGKIDGEDFAIVPVLAQVEYPVNGSTLALTLPDDVDVLAPASTVDGYQTMTDEDRTAVLTTSYADTSAAASGYYLRAFHDFTVTLTYTGSDGSSLSKTLTVQVTDDPAENPLPAADEYGIATIEERPTPSVTTGRITSIAFEGGTWLIWFNYEEAYWCDLFLYKS